MPKQDYADSWNRMEADYATKFCQNSISSFEILNLPRYDQGSQDAALVMSSHISEIILSSTECRDALMLRHTRHLRIYQFLATVEASTRSLMWFMLLIVNMMLCPLVRA